MCPLAADGDAQELRTAIGTDGCQDEQGGLDGVGCAGHVDASAGWSVAAAAAKVGRVGAADLPHEWGSFRSGVGCVRRRQSRRLFRLFAACGATGRAVYRYGCELLLLKSGRIACRYASELFSPRRPSGEKWPAGTLS